MTNFQKAFCVLMSLCFFAALTLAPDPFFQQDNVFRQLPLYCFLEKKAKLISQREDSETNERIIASNADYLGEQVPEKNGQVLGEGEVDEPAPNMDNQYAETSDKARTDDSGNTEEKTEIIAPHPEIDLSAETLADFDYLVNQFYIVDSNTAVSADQLNASEFLSADLTMKQDASKPQILIYHSHSQETFSDSREGEPEDTIVGVGNYLTRLLTENYGYNVIHVTETFDIIDGEIDRNRAYDYAREYLERVMEENPSIEVLIDLHRDGVSKNRRLVTEINGKDTAQIMFFNGLSYTVNNGPVTYLPNPYIQDNLAFSFQLEYQAALYYPELYRGIYLAGLRYNLHLCPKALLLEAGAQTNTVQEVKNAMEPFADILNRVLQGT